MEVYASTAPALRNLRRPAYLLRGSEPRPEPMKRTILAVLILLLGTSTLAGETRRYLIGTKRPLAAHEIRATLGRLHSDARHDRETAGIVPFESFAGFAADLTEDEAGELAASGRVRWIEPVVERHAFETRNFTGQTIPYGIAQIRATDTWAARRTGQVNVVVGDTGIDHLNPDLKNYFAGGYNAFNRGTNAVDDNGHGTHVAGTIAAQYNEFGVVGVALGVRLWAAKVLASNGNGNSEALVRAVDWTLSQKRLLGGNWVINFSLGSATPSSGEQEAFRRATDEGVIVVAASGNKPDGATAPAPVAYPAAYPTVIAVGAIDGSWAIADFSNQGPELDFVAPGTDILSTARRGKGSMSFLESGPVKYDAVPLTGSKLGVVTGEYVYCGLGKAGEFPASVSGKIALIKRGEIRFSEKARRAKESGAIGAAIYNNDSSARNWTLINDDEPQNTNFAWPVTLGLTLEDGEALRQSAPGTITLSYTPDDYELRSGTSMAAPHVTGAIALLWLIAPDATPGSLVSALTTTARDLGSKGPDSVFGVGAIDVYAAAMQLAPGAFDPTPVRPSTGRRITTRGKK